MRSVAFVSPLGGVGRTTLVAHSAALLAERGVPVVALELSAQNTLGLHLGMQDLPAAGWHTTVQAAGWLGDAALANAAGVRLLPYGANQGATQAQAPWPDTWLAAQLAALDLASQEVLLLDTPALPAPLARQALGCADVVVLVVDASLRAVQSHPSLHAWRACLQPHQQWGVVVTGVDPRSISRSHALAELRLQWSEQLLPYVVHHDEYLPQAQARGLCVHQATPHAQAAHDLQGIAAWLEHALAHPSVMLQGGV